MSLGVAMAGMTVMTFVLNNATSKAAPASAPAQPAPVAICLSAPVSPAAAASAAPR